MLPMDWAWLGRVAYRRALALQHGIRAAILEDRGRETLLLLEHPPTVTLGRRGGDADLRFSRDVLMARGVEVIETDRGGQATAHGPGQLVGYPIVDLRRRGLGAREYVQRLAGALRAVLAVHGVDAAWRDDAPGLWVGDAKIVAVGVHVHRGVTTHGFALNVQPDLSTFALIVPCGRPDAQATSMAAVCGESESVDALAEEVAAAIAAALGLEPRRLAAEVLLARAG